MTQTHSSLTPTQGDYTSRLFIANYGTNYADALNALASLPSLKLPAPMAVEVRMPIMPGEPCTIRLTLYKDRDGRDMGAYRQMFGGGTPQVRPVDNIAWLYYAVDVHMQFPNGVPCTIHASVPMDPNQVTRWYRSTYGPQDTWDGDVVNAYQGHYDTAREIHS